MAASDASGNTQNLIASVERELLLREDEGIEEGMDANQGKAVQAAPSTILDAFSIAPLPCRARSPSVDEVLPNPPEAADAPFGLASSGHPWAMPRAKSPVTSPIRISTLGAAAAAIANAERAVSPELSDYHDDAGSHTVVHERGASIAGSVLGSARSSQPPFRSRINARGGSKNVRWNTLKKQLYMNRLAGSITAPSGERKAAGEWDSIVRELARLNDNVGVLASALRAQRSSVMAEAPMSEMGQAYLEYCIDYTDKRPSVQVSVEVEEISDFQLATGHFHARFNVTLDWEETDFVEGVHYSQDQRSKQFVLSDSLLADPNAFNPRICVLNAVDIKGEEDPEQAFEPRIHRLVVRGAGSAARQTVWLTKEYKLKGTLKSPSPDGTNFPWDMQRLPIQVKSLPMEGQTTLGKERDVRLVEPVLRKMEVLEASKLRRRRKQADKMTLLRADDCPPAELRTLEAHKWSMVDKAQIGTDTVVPNFGVGEMSVCAFGGSDPAYDQYHVEVVLIRTWTHYFFDFFIQILLVLISLMSVWVPFNDDTTTNRLSISMTIVLAIVFFATTKPPAIQELTYNTMHDWWDNCMLIITVIGCLENVFVYMQCHGMDRSGKNEWDVGGGTWLPDSSCQEASFSGTSVADQWFAMIMLSVVVLIFIGLLIHAALYRLRFLMQVKNELKSCDMTVDDQIGWQTPIWDSSIPEHLKRTSTHGVPNVDAEDEWRPVNRLMLTAKGQDRNANQITSSPSGVEVRRRLSGFESAYRAFWMQNSDESAASREMVTCIARHGMPMLYVWPSFWVRCAEGNASCLSCLCCRRRRSACEHLPMDDPSSEHSTNQPAALGRSSSGLVEFPPSQEWLQKFVGLRPLLPPGEPARVVDCGTGEIGFYEYCWRSPNGADASKQMLYLDKNNKLKMDINKTFIDEFIIPQDGIERFAEHLYQEYFSPGVIKLRCSSSPRQSAFVSGKLGQTNNTLHPLSHAKMQPTVSRARSKILFGPTGQNRERLMRSGKDAYLVSKWVNQVEEVLNAKLADDHSGIVTDVLLFIPSAQDEATYELVATEFLVQRGDLSVTDLQQGLHKVPFAGFELNQAFMRAGRPRGKNSVGTIFSLPEFVREFQDLMDSEIDQAFMERIFEEAALQSATGISGSFAESSVLSEVIRNCAPLMRALIKHRLFNGTLSAGGGSCQITVKPDHEDRVQMKLGASIPRATNQLNSQPALNRNATSSQVLRTSEFHSVKLGNKTPITESTHGSALFPRDQPMSVELIASWRDHINTVMDDMDLNYKLEGNLRGVYIGISAVYYAAELAGCSEILLPKAAFLDCLDAKLQALLRDPPQPSTKKGDQVYDHRPFSNLVLVHTLVSRVLAETAWIVCKRKWRAEPAWSTTTGEGAEDHSEALPEYVATWSLGFFLSQGSQG